MPIGVKINPKARGTSKGKKENYVRSLEENIYVGVFVINKQALRC